MHWRRKWQPTPVFFPGESQGRGSLVGLCLWGRTESDTTEATQQQQQQQYFAKNFCISIHPGYWPIVLLSCSIFIWLWYQSNVSLIEWTWKCMLLLSFWEKFQENWYYFFKCLVEVTSESRWSWAFLWGRLLITSLILLLTIGLFRFSVSSWFSLVRLHVSRILFFSSRLPN